MVCDASLWASSALTFWMSQNSISINSPTPLITYSGVAALSLQKAPMRPQPATAAMW